MPKRYEWIATTQKLAHYLSSAATSRAPRELKNKHDLNGLVRLFARCGIDMRKSRTPANTNSRCPMRLVCCSRDEREASGFYVPITVSLRGI